MNSNMSIALPGTDTVIRKQFSNGVTVLVHENPWSNTAAIRGSLYAGSCLESPEQVGLSAFLSQAFAAGTQFRTCRQISNYLESIGADLSFISGPHAINIKGKCLSEDLPDMLILLKEMLDSPSFPEHELEVIRNRAFDDLEPNIYVRDDPAYDVFKEFLWGQDHPYGRMKYDSAKGMADLSRDDLLNFHKRFAGPKNLILVIVGNFRSSAVMDRCEEIFGGWEKKQEIIDEDKLFPLPEIDRETTFLHMESHISEEVSLIVGTFGPAFGDPDCLSAKIGNCILGDVGMAMGRIGRMVREKHGLAYEVYSYLDPKKKGGCWSVQAGVHPENLVKTTDLIFDEIRRFTTEHVSSDELESAKSWFIGSLPLEFANNSFTASMLFNLAFYEQDLDYYRCLPKYVAAVTPETILAASQKWIDPNKMLKVTVGCIEEIRKAGWWKINS